MSFSSNRCASALCGWGAPTRYIGIFESTKITNQIRRCIHSRFQPTWIRCLRKGRCAAQLLERPAASYQYRRTVHGVGLLLVPGEPTPQQTCGVPEPHVEFHGNRGLEGLPAVV